MIQEALYALKICNQVFFGINASSSSALAVNGTYCNSYAADFCTGCSSFDCSNIPKGMVGDTCNGTFPLPIAKGFYEAQNRSLHVNASDTWNASSRLNYSIPWNYSVPWNYSFPRNNSFDSNTSLPWNSPVLGCASNSAEAQTQAQSHHMSSQNEQPPVLASARTPMSVNATQTSGTRNSSLGKAMVTMMANLACFALGYYLTG